ncbi:MAG: hypothetical protein IIC91_01220 [Chloroflexi bacterium]|nr:hypothetical protein [Chloroflexota bacterium]
MSRRSRRASRRGPVAVAVVTGAAVGVAGIAVPVDVGARTCGPSSSPPRRNRTTPTTIAVTTAPPTNANNVT